MISLNPKPSTSQETGESSENNDSTLSSRSSTTPYVSSLNESSLNTIPETDASATESPPESLSTPRPKPKTAIRPKVLNLRVHGPIM